MIGARLGDRFGLSLFGKRGVGEAGGKGGGFFLRGGECFFEAALFRGDVDDTFKFYRSTQAD